MLNRLEKSTIVNNKYYKFLVITSNFKFYSVSRFIIFKTMETKTHKPKIDPEVFTNSIQKFFETWKKEII